MHSDESDRLLTLMDDAIHQSHRSRREIERTLGLSQGYLGSLFKGRIQLKVSHVYSISRVLDLEPLTFFLKASPPSEKDRASLLEQLGEGPKAFALLNDAPPSRSEIQEMIRDTVREEMERLRNEKPDEDDPAPA